MGSTMVQQTQFKQMPIEEEVLYAAFIMPNGVQLVVIEVNSSSHHLAKKMFPTDG